MTTRPIRTGAAFALLPVQRQDFSAFLVQWRIVARLLANLYVRLGLIPGDSTEVGVLDVLVLVARGWSARWVPTLVEGWQAGSDEGLTGHVGGLSDAIWTGRHEIMRDTAAVVMGWSMCLAAAFGLASAALHGMVGVAHAQTAGGTGASTDMARTILGDMFTFIGSGSPLAQGLALIAQTLSTAAVTIGGLMMVWTIVIMVIDYTTDLSGARQRWSPVMFFLRCAVVIPLLAPLNGGWDGGQRLAGAAAAWGSDQATVAWTAMVNYLTDSKSWVAAPLISEVDLENTVAGTVAAEACMASINSDPAQQGHVAVTYDATSGRYDLYVTDEFLGQILAEAGGCGTVSFSNPTAQGAQASNSTSVAAFLSAQQAAFATMQGSVRSTVATMVANHIACRDTPTSCAIDPDPSLAAGFVTAYQTGIQNAINGAMANVTQSATQSLATNATVNGWIGAAAWANSLSQLQSSIDGAAGAIPQVAAPKTKNPFVASSVAWLNNGFQGGGNSGGASGSSAAAGTPVAQARAAVEAGSTTALDKLFVAVTPNTLQVFPTLNTMSPLAGMGALGRWTYRIALALKVGAELVDSKAVTGSMTAVEWLMALPTAGASVLAGEAAKAGVRTVVSTVDIVWGPMVLLGMALAYFVPALPFVRMLFGVMGWLIAFVEAVFLVPVMLVMMINAEPGGLFGSAAKSCLWTIAALIVRPILTVAGFVVGIMIITEMVSVLNMIMVPMISNNESSNFVFFGFFAYVAIYLGVAYVIVNTATKMAEILPNAAYKWMGANAGGERDDAGAVGVALGAALGRFGLAGRAGSGKGNGEATTGARKA